MSLTVAKQYTPIHTHTLYNTSISVPLILDTPAMIARRALGRALGRVLLCFLAHVANVRAQQCAGNYYGPGTSCTLCPLNTTSAPDSQIITDCKCPAGYTGPDGRAVRLVRTWLLQGHNRLRRLHRLQRIVLLPVRRRHSRNYDDAPRTKCHARCRDTKLVYRCKW